jgi:hypothetical protein
VNDIAFIPARIPTIIDESAIAGEALRIHPADLRELQTIYRFCWPGNAPRDEFRGTRLVADVEAPMLPRRTL